ncbi:MAG TPA: twitching motility protein PilT, partial [Planctomycetaceae bacterium]|nr:twitching motility protein PilT [Planctomycetaceae bacterium]
MVRMHEWTKSTYVPGKELEIDKIFRMAVKYNASDLHLQVGRPPILRI